MKRVGFVLLLLLGVGLCTGLAFAGITGYYSPPLDRVCTIKVGDAIVATLNLIYFEDNASEANTPLVATVTPLVPYGLTTSGPSMYTITLYPGRPESVSYMVVAEQPGYYEITSLVSYEEGGFIRQVGIGASLVVVSQSPESTPPSAPPSGSGDLPPVVPGPAIHNFMQPRAVSLVMS